MIYFSVFIGVVIVDQLTKSWLSSFLRLYEVKEIIPGFFNLVHVTNSGAAFSMFANINSPWRHYFFLVMGGVAVAGLTFACWRMRKKHWLYCFALGLIGGGAVGNLIDRVRFGSVIDFLDFFVGRYHWPSFNIADSAICIGAGLFLIISITDAPGAE